MKTEDLNEYIFTKLVDDYAQRARRTRIEDGLKRQKAEGHADDSIIDSPLTADDLRKGFEMLALRRRVVVDLLKEAWTDPSGAP